MSDKKCGCCQEVLSSESFHKDSKTVTGLACYCIACTKVKNAEAHAKKKDNFNYKTMLQYNASKTRARNKGLEHTLTLEQLRSLYPPDMICPALDIQMEWGNPKWTSPSLDRIDPTLGYTFENCQIISNKANVMKNDATLEELESLVAFLKEITF